MKQKKKKFYGHFQLWLKFLNNKPITKQSDKNKKCKQQNQKQNVK